ncbi:MAG: uracil-DNA glycosylase family protein [Pseudomonadota bacterium]
MNPADQSLPELVKSVRACRLCEDHLPEGPNPVLQIDGSARILIAGQAPGRRVHESGVPFDDPSGDRLRDWLGVTREVFYDPTQIALLPMGFCYPGTGKSGDLPPRRECEPAWRPALLQHLTALKLTLVVGQYAIKSHLPDVRGTLTNTVQHWQDYGTRLMPLPHPSPRNNIWLKKNPWFEAQLLPELRRRVSDALAS